MNLTQIPIEKLVEDPNNVRLHGERNVAAVKRSIEQFGQVEPLVVQKKGNKVIGGNARLGVLRELQHKTVPCVVLDIDDDAATALGIALNRTSELAEWNYEALSVQLQAIVEDPKIDLNVSGWSADELSNLLANSEWVGMAGDPNAPEHVISALNSTIHIVFTFKKSAKERAGLIDAFVGSIKKALLDIPNQFVCDVRVGLEKSDGHQEHKNKLKLLGEGDDDIIVSLS